MSVYRVVKREENKRVDWERNTDEWLNETAPLECVPQGLCDLRDNLQSCLPKVVNMRRVAQVARMNVDIVLKRHFW